MRRIVPGEILQLAEGDWKYGHGTLTMRVDRIREDISGYYEGAWVWVEGYELGPDGAPLYRLQALIRTAAGSADTTASPSPDAPASPSPDAPGEAGARTPTAAAGADESDGEPGGAGEGGAGLPQPDSAP